MPGEHAEYAPSSAHRWLVCPGSVVLTRGVAEPEASSYAHEGSMCHELAAECLKSNKDAAGALGQSIGGVEMTQDLIDAVQMYIDEVRSIASEMAVKGGLVEKTVEITKDCWGTLDAALWNPEVLVVIDAKFGKGVIVEAEDNPQLKIYAIGILKQKQIKPVPKKVILKIVQPRTVNPVREFEMSTQDLQEWAKGTLAPALERLRKGDTSCVPGEKTCLWCLLSAQCRARADDMVNRTAQAFEPFTQVAPPSLPETATGGDLLDVAALAELAKSFKAIEDWIKSIREELTTRGLAGEDIPGFKMVEGRSNRLWKDDETSLVKTLREYDIEPYEEKLKTPPAVEKAIGKKRAKEIDLDSLIIKPKGKPTLVPATDKRPAISMNVEKQFEDFVEAPAIVETKEDEKAEESSGMSLMQRLMAAGDDDEETPEEEALSPEFQQLVEDHDKPALAQPDEEVTEDVKSSGDATPPAAPKRKQVLEAAQTGEHTLKSLAAECGATENGIRMHLRYLHERDGYGYLIYNTGRVEIVT